MANWVGVSRTNYFAVKDPAKFKADMGEFEVEVVEKDGRFALISANDYGDWPSFDYRGYDPAEAEDDPPDAWFPEVVAKYLADGEVAVFQTIGAEKARYLSGYAVAMRSDKQYVQVSIDDIYEMAHKQLGTRPTAAMY